MKRFLIYTEPVWMLIVWSFCLAVCLYGIDGRFDAMAGWLVALRDAWLCSEWGR